jgi:hypothetical protein
MSPKELADEQSKVIFENDDVMFIEIYGYQAMEYYGSEYLNRTYKPNKLRGGDLYLVIDKKGDNNYQIFEPKRGNVEIEDFDGKMKEFFEIIKKYPPLEKILIDLITINTPYGMLLTIKNGVDVDRWRLRDIDDCFGHAVFNSKNPGKSMINLLFDESEFFGFFEFSEGDYDKGILESIFGSRYGGYYGYDIYDSDTIYYEWKEGYILRNINDENEQLLTKIVTIASPALLKFKDNQDKYYENVSKFLDDNFSGEAQNMKDEYKDLLNNGADEKIKKFAISDIGDPFRNYGVIVKGDKYFSNYVTTVNVLLTLYGMTGVDKNASIKDLFEKLGKSLDLNIGNYNEIGRESYEIDEEKLNDVVKTNLEEILEYIEENPEQYEGTKKYGEVLQTLDKMGYNMGEQYPLPFDNKKRFRIEDINKDNYRINLIHFDGIKGEKRSYSLEEFNNYLQSPELFESLVKKLKKML